MLQYAETLVPRWTKLTAGSILAPFHFSEFEESVLNRSALHWALERKVELHLEPSSR
jgi:hypothetical protein